MSNLTCRNFTVYGLMSNLTSRNFTVHGLMRWLTCRNVTVYGLMSCLTCRNVTVYGLMSCLTYGIRTFPHGKLLFRLLPLRLALWKELLHTLWTLTEVLDQEGTSTPS